MDVLSRDPPRADRRIHYGSDPSQFGDLWLPRQRAGHPWPVLVFVHGGWWSSAYDLGYAGFLCDAFRQCDLAVWSLEYRRTGMTGGGWPTTFEDVAHGFDYLAELARTTPLRLDRVVVAGHSAGGHLAFWLAGRPHVPPASPLAIPPRVPIHAAVSFAGAVDLTLLLQLSTGAFSADRDWVSHLMGGTPQSHPDRYAAGDPGQLLPLPCPQLLIQGSKDQQIPPRLPQLWADKARRGGGSCSLLLLPGADHFDVVDPQSSAWPQIRRAVQALFVNER